MQHPPRLLWISALICLGVVCPASAFFRSQSLSRQTRDDRVRQFLEQHRSHWHDLNVPEADGKLLHDLILEHGYKQALEIGTSTGHSGIWIAWALSKTGGRLITVEIDAGRHRTAVANFREAGVADLIDARLGDAHKLVPQMQGTFDFVFCDADKDWYQNYLSAMLPKLAPGGCFAAHNVSESRFGWVGEYLAFARSQSVLETTVNSSRSSGIALSFKRTSAAR
jgi:caffeoyl-CoA O-methyltransferase